MESHPRHSVAKTKPGGAVVISPFFHGNAADFRIGCLHSVTKTNTESHAYYYNKLYPTLRSNNAVALLAFKMRGPEDSGGRGCVFTNDFPRKNCRGRAEKIGR